MSAATSAACASCSWRWGVVVARGSTPGRAWTGIRPNPVWRGNRGGQPFASSSSSSACDRTLRLGTPFWGGNPRIGNGFGRDTTRSVASEGLSVVSNKHRISASMFLNSSNFALASNLFTFGTVFVMPFYSLMIFAPKWETTKRVIESSLPFVIMSCLYLFLLCLSWKSETLALMFSSKYLLPELLGITKMFSCPLTISSAWIHLLCVDLFSARHVFLDGLLHNVETRHSIVLCLMFGPIGILCHLLSKAIQLYRRGKVAKDLLEETNFA